MVSRKNAQKMENTGMINGRWGKFVAYRNFNYFRRPSTPPVTVILSVCSQNVACMSLDPAFEPVNVKKKDKYFHSYVTIKRFFEILTLQTEHVAFKATAAAAFCAFAEWPACFFALADLSAAFCWDWIFCWPLAMINLMNFLIKSSFLVNVPCHWAVPCPQKKSI